MLRSTSSKLVATDFLFFAICLYWIIRWEIQFSGNRRLDSGSFAAEVELEILEIHERLRWNSEFEKKSKLTTAIGVFILWELKNIRIFSLLDKLDIYILKLFILFFISNNFSSKKKNIFTIYIVHCHKLCKVHSAE